MKVFYLVSLLVVSIQAQPFRSPSNLDSLGSGNKNDQLSNFVRRSPQKSLSPSEIRAQYLRSGGGTPIPLSDDQVDAEKNNSSPGGSSSVKKFVRSSGPASSSSVKKDVRSSGPSVASTEDSSFEDSSMEESSTEEADMEDSGAEDSSAKDSEAEDSGAEDSSTDDSGAEEVSMADTSSEPSGPSGLAAIPAGIASAAFNLVKNIFFTRKN